MEDLLVGCVTGTCCAGFGLVTELTPVKRFEEPDREAWLLSGPTSHQADVLPCGLVFL